MALALRLSAPRMVAAPEYPDHRPIFDGFNLIGRLNAGGMAEILLATPVRKPNRLVALKRILPAYRSDPSYRRMLVTEAELSRRLRHPNIIRTFGTGCGPSDEPYMVMEFVDGIDLKRLAWSMWSSGDGMPMWLSVHIVSEVLAALSFAHGQVDPSGRPAPVLHRDISPENIMLTSSGRTKVGDFGIADSLRSVQDRPRGKFPYMAPEVFAEAPLDGRVDLFSAGVVLWELLTGRHLFRAPTPREAIAQVCAQPRIPPSRLNPAVPEALDELVVSALDPSPTGRPSSALTMHAALQRILEGVHSEGFVNGKRVAPVIAAHLHVARTPSEQVQERPLADVPDILELSDDRLFAEPEVQPEDDGTTYAIIRRDRPNPSADEGRLTTDELLKAYLDDAPIPAVPGLVDTLDLAPGALVEGPGERNPHADLEEPFPVWVTTAMGEQGPLRPSRAFSYIAGQDPDTLFDIRLSANRNRWVSLDRLAYLLDDELVAPQLAVRGCEMQGRISRSSVTAVLGTQAASRTARRLIFTRAVRGTVERYEIQVSDGRVIATHANDLFFELWAMLLHNPYLREIGLPAAFHEALLEDRKLIPRLPTEAVTAIQQARGLAKRRALRQLITWPDGAFGVNARVTANVDETSVPLLRMLPRLVARQFGSDQLQAYLTPLLKRPLWRCPRFEEEIRLLRLRPTERRRAEAFGHGRTLFESLEYANAGYADTRHAHVIAYLLLELGLVREGDPTYAVAPVCR